MGDTDVDLYGFPAVAEVPQLAWLGPDYRAAIVRALLTGLRERDAATEVLGVKCEQPPQLQARVRDGVPGGTVAAQQARFALQVLVRGGDGQHWRLRGTFVYTGDALDTGEPQVRYAFDLDAAEPA